MRDPKERLQDMLDAIEAIERYCVRGKTAFEQDELLQVWFVHHLQLIGEAARTLPAEVRALAPNIPWAKLTGMRNILVHNYFEIDTEIVWDTVMHDLPILKTALQNLLSLLESKGT